MNGVNGVEGFVQVLAEPIIEATLLLEGNADPLPGMHDDFAAGTAKQILCQWGTTSGKTVAIDMPRCFFLGAPVRADVGNLQGVRVRLRGATAAMAAESTANYLINSPLRIHFF